MPDSPTIPYYLGAPTKTALDASPFVIPETSQIVTGSDPATSAPDHGFGENPPDGSASWTDKFFTYGPNARARFEAANKAAGESTQSGSFTSFKPVLYGALVVVIGLLIVSRGFGLLGEEGENVVVSLGNPQKFPGVGHAISGLKR